VFFGIAILGNGISLELHDRGQVPEFLGRKVFWLGVGRTGSKSTEGGRNR
jgi:hypothetical protein